MKTYKQWLASKPPQERARIEAKHAAERAERRANLPHRCPACDGYGDYKEGRRRVSCQVCIGDGKISDERMERYRADVQRARDDRAAFLRSFARAMGPDFQKATGLTDKPGS